jgi:hypothetical protein
LDRVVELLARVVGGLLEAAVEGGLVRLVGEQQSQQRFEVDLGIPWWGREPGVQRSAPIAGDLVDRPLSAPVVLELFLLKT